MPKNPLSSLPSCAVLDKLLNERVEHPERAKTLDAKIKKTFDKKVAILILDMSGFSRLVQRYGIIHYLAMIRRMRRVVAPVIAKNKGMVVKFEADNAFAVFPKPENALSAAIEINHDLEVANLSTPDESDVFVSIGIGYGTTLLACDDMYGNEMNLASKLGEDTAERGEILLTEAAQKECAKKFKFSSFPLTISGVTLKAYKYKSG
ncbi:adenylate/guanylate cyclase domain-containing protein [Candidatus Uhrbacteria bacterium]|nr:adenylate/guanylate cyclase domain-containing protein [Candidatus Uhrbacteria bacterium]